MAHTIFVICCLLLLIDKGQTQVDPCTHYLDLDDRRRSTAFDADSSQGLLCDKYIVFSGQWYRFLGNGGSPVKIPEGCVSTELCGTLAPIWLDGIHPDEGNTTAAYVSVCANYYDETCCDWTADIQVQWCPQVNGEDAFYVYELVTPEICDSAYCAGDQPMCEDNEFYNLYTEECQETVNDTINWMYSNVNLGWYWWDWYNDYNDYSSIDAVQVLCQIEYKNYYIDNFCDTDDGLRYLVTFFATKNNISESLYSEQIACNQTQVILEEHYLIHCEAQPFWIWQSGPIPGTPSEKSYSTFVGVWGPGYPIDIYAYYDWPVSAHLYSSIPIVCGCCERFAKMTKDQCDLKFEVVTKATHITIGAQQAHPCKYLLSRNITHTLIPLNVQSRPGTTSSVQVFEFEFKPLDLTLYARNVPLIWHKYQLDPFLVRLHDNVTMGYCWIGTDPWIERFDWRWYMFDYVGEFILWRTQGQLFEAQARLKLMKSPWSSSVVSVVCAVAVRERNDIIVVDVCENNKPLKIYRRLYGGGAVVNVGYNGKGIYLTMASGALIDVWVSNWDGKPFLNLNLIAPKTHFNKTEGLCGNYVDPNYDYYEYQIDDNFTETFRVDQDASFFSPSASFACEGENVDASASSCVCNKDTNEILCGKTADEYLANLNNELVEQKPLAPPGVIDCTDGGTGRKRRNVDEFYEEGDDEMDINIDYEFDLGLTYVPVTKSWPTPSGITQQQAKQVCEDEIHNSDVYDTCEDMVNTTQMLTSCEYDIQSADNVSIADGWRLVLESSCSHTAVTSIKYEEDGNMETATQVILDAIVKNVCPQQCSGHGRCVDAKCQCQSGYIGADCSLQEGQAPILLDLMNDAMCDVQKKPCRKIRLTAVDVTYADGMTCKFKNYKLVGVKWIVHGEVLGTMSIESAWQVVCYATHVPVSRLTTQQGEQHSAYMMRVSISNDGKHFSTGEVDWLVFNSLCIDCNDGQCTKKKNTCLIDGQCYNSGDKNPANSKQSCDLNTSDIQWTPPNDDASQENRDPDSQSKKDQDSDTYIWGEWSELSNCSVECDFGVRSRERECSELDKCLGSWIETEVCTHGPCAEVSDEKENGVFIAFENSPFEVAEKSSDLTKEVAHILSDHCSDALSTCCEAFDVKHKSSKTSTPDLIRQEHIQMAKGYPKNETVDTSSVLLMVGVEENYIIEICTGEEKKRKKRNDKNLRYMDATVASQIVQGNIETLDENVGLDVLYVHSDPIEELKRYLAVWQYCAVGIAALILVAGVMFSILMACKHKKKNRRSVSASGMKTKDLDVSTGDLNVVIKAAPPQKHSIQTSLGQDTQWGFPDAD